MLNNQKVLSTYQQLKEGLPTNSRICYSIKSNYSSSIISTLQQTGAWFEVSSEHEYNYLHQLSVEPKNIVVNAPVASKEFILQSAKCGSIFHIQNESQWVLIKELANTFPAFVFTLGIRLNYSTSSRFGLTKTTAKGIGKEAKSIPNIHITTLHVHVCENERSANSFANKHAFLIHFEEELELNTITSLNVGGGFYSEMPKDLQLQFNEPIPSIEDYLIALNTHKSSYSLLIEPGALLVANALDFYTKVVSIDTINEQAIIQVDGSIYDIMPTKSKKQLPFTVFSDNGTTTTGKIVGFTCMEDDILVNNFSETIAVGDWVCFSNVGGYAQNLRPNFITPPKPVLKKTNEEYELVKDQKPF